MGPPMQMMVLFRGKCNLSLMGSMTFDDQVAIVTGAGGGLGRCHALELARRGARAAGGGGAAGGPARGGGGGGGGGGGVWFGGGGGGGRGGPPPGGPGGGV